MKHPDFYNEPMITILQFTLHITSEYTATTNIAIQETSNQRYFYPLIRAFADALSSQTSLCTYLDKAYIWV